MRSVRPRGEGNDGVQILQDGRLVLYKLDWRDQNELSGFEVVARQHLDERQTGEVTGRLGLRREGLCAAQRTRRSMALHSSTVKPTLIVTCQC